MLNARTFGLVAATALGLSTLAAPAQATVSSYPIAGTPSFNGPVLVVRQLGGTMYVGGDFTSVNDGSGSVFRANAAAYSTATGQLLSWSPDVNGPVRDLEVRRDGVYLGGTFTAVNGQGRRNFARVRRGGEGAPNGFARKFNGPVSSVEIQGRTVFVGGDFSRVDGKPRTRLASLTRTGRLRAWAPKAGGGEVFDIEANSRGVYVAGSFRTVNGRAKHGHLTLVTTRAGRIVRRFDAPVSQPVIDIDVRGPVYAGVGGASGGLALRLNGRTGVSAWSKRFDGDVQAITVMDGEVYAAGHFRQVCNTSSADAVTGDCRDGGVSRGAGASLSAQGQLTGWNPRANSQEGVVTIVGDSSARRITIGGYFTTVAGGGSARPRLATFAE